MRPKTTLEAIDVKEEKKEFTKIFLKANEIQTMRTTLNDSQKAKPYLHKQSKSLVAQ
jgi:phosphoribosylamine-glycine ligase